MNRTAHDCKMDIHNRLLALRNMFTLVSTERFSELYDEVSEANRVRIWKAIESNDANELGKLIRDLSKVSLETMTMRDLRKIGQDYGIRGYNVLPKSSLLSAIYVRERVNAQRNIGANEQAPAPSKDTTPEDSTTEGTIPISG